MARSSAKKKPPSRGRPKGTGLDDQAVLAKLAALLKADHKLSPTAAIRKAGITNASIIRRLRDKLKTASNPVAPARRAAPAPTAKAKQRKPAGVPPKQPQPRKAAAQRATPAPATRKSEPIQVSSKASNPTPQPQQAATPPPSTSAQPPQPAAPTSGLFQNAAALRISLETAAAMARMQRQVFDQTLTATPLGTILRAQSMFAEFIATAMLGHLALLRPPAPENK